MNTQEKLTPISIFLSYSWKDKQIAEVIHDDLQQVGINIVRDSTELQYKDDINEFMRKIRDTDFAILLLSDDYLRSQNCLFEAFEIHKEKNSQKKILPILIKGCNFFKTADRLEYLQYWQEQKQSLSEKLHGVEPTTALSAFADLKMIHSIHSQIDDFLKGLSSIIHITFNELKAEKYASLFSAVGIDDLAYLKDLIKISLLKDLDEKEVALDTYFEKYKPNSYSYCLRASLAKKRGNFEKAKLNYEKSLALDPSNVEALNNFGQLLEIHYKEYDKAKQLYENALKTNPQLTITRINLGNLLSRHYKNEQGALDQFKEILSYDPYNEDAYNNIGNCYRSDALYNIKEAEANFIAALKINPKHFYANLNYANLLEVSLKKFNLSEEYYKNAISSAYNDESRKVAQHMLNRFYENKSLIKKQSRNELCNCGSNKKYKNCCGKGS